jgi:transposase
MYLLQLGIKSQLAPALQKDDVVVMDNLASHKVAGALEPLFERGAKVMFLPPYSYDYNPIELSWSKMKAVLRKLKARSYEELVAGMKTALGAITASDIAGWFQHCGYNVNN